MTLANVEEHLPKAIKYSLNHLQESPNFYRKESGFQSLIFEYFVNIFGLRKVIFEPQNIDLVFICDEGLIAAELKYYSTIRENGMGKSERLNTLADICKAQKHIIQNKFLFDINDICCNKIVYSFSILLINGDCLCSTNDNTYQYFRLNNPITNINELQVQLPRSNGRILDITFSNVPNIMWNHIDDARFYIIKFPQDPI